MINHARILLLNKKAINYELALEEYIDPNFEPIELGIHLNELRDILLLNNESRLVCNYRVKQLMTLLHADSKAEECILCLDNRITYLKNKKITFYDVNIFNDINIKHIKYLLDDLNVVVDKFYELYFDKTNDCTYGNLTENDPSFNLFEDMWNSELFSQKINGIVLALIYHTEDTRREMERKQVLALA